nr:hypothetical protein [Lachnospiraceae bacterium]
MRAITLQGMSEEEIARLTENIKIANLQMEEAYMYDDLFGKLEDKEHLYWNYFDANNFIELLNDMKSSIENTSVVSKYYGVLSVYSEN